MIELVIVMLGMVATKALLGFHFPWEKCECCGGKWGGHVRNDETGFFKEYDLIAAAANLSVSPTSCPTCHETWEECVCCGVCGEKCSGMGPGGCEWGEE